MSLLLFHVWPDENSNENGKAVASPASRLQSKQAVLDVLSIPCIV